MPRTTASQVELVVEVDAAIDLEAFIAAANEIVTEVCVPLEYSDTRLELIERWLSAHFYKIRDQAVASEKAGPVAESFQHKVDLLLMQTKEGQMAMLLDTKGGLARLQKALMEGRIKSGLKWLGTAAGDEEAYA